MFDLRNWNCFHK